MLHRSVDTRVKDCSKCGRKTYFRANWLRYRRLILQPEISDHYDNFCTCKKWKIRLDGIHICIEHESLHDLIHAEYSRSEIEEYIKFMEGLGCKRKKQ